MRGMFKNHSHQKFAIFVKDITTLLKKTSLEVSDPNK